MEGYPYTDYYRNPVDSLWHVVTHYGPNSRGAYTGKLWIKAKTEKEAKEFIKEKLKEKARKRNDKRK